MDKIEIKVYQVKCGDCFYLRYISMNKIINIFIDAGYTDTYKKTFKNDVKAILERGEKIDLFVITHIDQDHIGGIKPFLREFDINAIEEFWFNQSDKFEIRENDFEHEISVKQGINLRDYYHSKGRNFKEVIAGDILNIADLITFKILSPTQDDLTKFKEEWKQEEQKFEFEIASKLNDYGISIEELISNIFKEDTDLVNKSSIAFLIEIGQFKAFFSADAHPSIICKSLRNLGYSKQNRLKLDILKVPHHGSKGNLSYELLELLDCQNFIFSANGINRDNLPNKETIARIVGNPSRDFNKKIKLYFNYDNERLQSIRTCEEEITYNFECIYTKSSINHLQLSHEIFREFV